MLHQGSEWVAYDTPLTLKEISAPDTPLSGYLKLYAKTTGLFFMGDGGVEVGPLAAAVTTLDHGALTGLTDDDHTIYALLAGRSGGQTLKGGTASGDDLTLMSTNHATKGHLLFGTSGYDEVNNRLGIGTTSPAFGVHASGASPGCHVSGNRLSADALGPAFIGQKARGTPGSPSVVLADDQLLQLVGQGYENGSYHTQANIKQWAGENWSGSAKGTYITFETSALLGTTIAERFRIGPSGQLGIGGATYGSAGAYFRSAGSAAAPVWSTLILPNAATANRIVYASSSNTYGESADLTFDGTDFILGSGIRARMASQNRIRYLNSTASAYRNSNQTLSNNTNTAISFDTEQFDTDTIHDNSTNPTRMTAKIAGKFLVTCSMRFDGNATGSRVITVQKNGTTLLSQNGSKDVDGNHVIVTGSPVVASLAANDYIEILAFQDSGGNLDIVADTRNHVTLTYIGE